MLTLMTKPSLLRCVGGAASATAFATLPLALIVPLSTGGGALPGGGRSRDSSPLPSPPSRVGRDDGDPPPHPPREAGPSSPMVSRRRASPSGVSPPLSRRSLPLCLVSLSAELPRPPAGGRLLPSRCPLSSQRSALRSRASCGGVPRRSSHEPRGPVSPRVPRGSSRRGREPPSRWPSSRDGAMR